MKNLETTTHNEQALAVIPIDKNQEGIDNHRKIALHLETAGKYHRRAALHHENGHHEKAAQNALIAYGHVSLANKAQKKDAKQHALNG